MLRFFTEAASLTGQATPSAGDLGALLAGSCSQVQCGEADESRGDALEAGADDRPVLRDAAAARRGTYSYSYEHSPTPTLEPSTQAPTPVTLKPSPQPSAPTQQPTPKPTAAPSPKPTTLPTPAPSTFDTVAVSVSLSVSASSADNITDAVLVSALAGKLSGADSSTAVKNFAVAFTARRRRLEAGFARAEQKQFKPNVQPGQGTETTRKLGTATVTFDVVVSLSALGVASAGTFQAALQDSLDLAVSNGSLTADLQSSCSCAEGLSVTSVALASKREYPSLRPSPAPTEQPSPSPTQAPTPTPTTQCTRGQYFSELTGLCTSCPAGKHGNITRPPWLRNCFLW